MIYRAQGPREGEKRETGDARVLPRLDAQEELFWQMTMYFAQAVFFLLLCEPNHRCALRQWIFLAD